MSRLNWNVPEGRFFDTGLDRGVLYPKGAPPAPVDLFRNLFPNPSFEGTAGAFNQMIMKNLAFNPRGISGGQTAEFGARWSWVLSYLTTGVNHPHALITTAARYTVPAAGETNVTSRGIDYYANPDIAPGTSGGATLQAVTPGETIWASEWVRPSVSTTMRLSLKFHNGAGAWVGASSEGPDVACPANVWTRLSHSATVPATATHMAGTLRNVVATTFPTGSTLDFTGLMFTRTQWLQDYFDGGLRTGKWNHSDFTQVWDGTTNLSQSTVRAAQVVTSVNASRVQPILSTAWAKHGSYSMRLIAMMPQGTSVWGKDNYASVNLLNAGCQEGKTYTVRGTMRQAEVAKSASAGDIQGRTFFVDITGGGGGTRGLATIGAPANVAGEHQISLTFSVPKVSGSPVTSLNLRIYSGEHFGGTDIWWDELILAEGMGNKVPDYFDGNTEDTDKHLYRWEGTPNASTSVMSEIQTLAVPWMGLQSVDEEGGDSAAAYYIDGRPFLFLPRPKEYKATLKAMTYPDAFAEIMGVQEVADGMYLDSQPGSSFDLSYRTLIGNAIDGVDHGYKIHLVYNATVAPQALTYESMSNSINPTAFSWEIQAVPVPVEGFRPTAHIIIDTRHMQQSKIDAVEELIYGGEEHVATMPSPQAIFDLLSFGDTIVVTDNGDGTFDVTGSYENVYMVGDGLFRVDNVDGQDNGDGTFTISTTLE